MNKKETQFVNNYFSSNMHDLYDLYNNPSFYKTRAEYTIKQEMNDYNGYDYRVCGGNTMTFTCAYRVKENDKEILVYHTAYNTYKIELVQ